MSERFPVNRPEDASRDQGLIETGEMHSDEITGGSITDLMNEAQAIKDARDAEAARQSALLNQDQEDYLAANERDAYGDAYREAANQTEGAQASGEQAIPDQEDYRGPNEYDPLGDAHREALAEQDESGEVQPDNTVLNVQNRKPIVYVNIDQSYDSKTNARDRAERRHAAEMERSSGIGGFLNKIWKGNLAKLYYIKKYTNEAELEHERNQNINHGSEMSAEDQARATQLLLEQFGNEDANDSAIHFGAGEEKRVHSADGEYATGIKDIIRKNFDGEYATQDDFVEAHKRFVQQYRENHSNEGSTNEGLVEVNNLFDIANAVRSSVEHGESLDNVLSNMIIVSGESRTGVRTEAELDVVDKIVEKFSKSKIGMLVSPNTVAVASSIALSIANFGGRSLFGAITKAFVPGAAASLWAGAREHALSKKDRATNSRERARGETSQSDDRLRDDMEQTRYETVSAEELMNSIDSSCFEGMFDDCDQEQSHSKILDALGNIAAIETRIRLSDETSADFISYSNVLVGTERLELDRKLAEAKVLLNNQIESNAINLDDLYRKFGLSEYGPDEMTDLGANKLGEIVEIISGAFEDSIEDDVTDKDASFRVLKGKRVAVAVAKAFVTGTVIGTIVGELLPNRFGIVDKMMGGNLAPGESVTIPEALFGGNTTTSAVEINPANLANLSSSGGEIPLSSGGKLVATGDNLFSMFGSNNAELVSDLKINPDGNFSEEAIKQLGGQGIDVASSTEGVEVIVNQATEVSKADFVQNHLSEMTKITHDLWYDNNTPAPVFDKNELGLHLGSNGGVTETGYQYNISSMAADGSYHEGFSADATVENLKAAITVDDATGSHVIMLDIDKQTGSIDIPKGSLASNFFNVDADGQAEFTGAYLEVVQVNGIDAAGVEHISPLATLEGTNSPESILDSVPTKVIENHVVHNFTENHNIVIPPFIPVEPRETMKTTRRGVERGYGYNTNYNYMSNAEMESRRSETSPRLIENPEAILVPGDEYSFYKDLLRSNKGNEYVAEIESVVSKSPELNSIDSNIKTIVKIPVNAAGESESENIYNVLTKAYGSQKQEALENSLILLHVNWFDRYDKDEAALRANIAKTRSEIQRAKNDFPQIKIATIESEWKRSEIKGGIIGYVSRKLDDVALLALESATSSGRMDKSQDVLLIRNDADPKGLATNYLERYNGDFANNPTVDIFTGTTSFDNTKASRLPGFVFAANFMQSLDIISASRGERVHTAGANFGVRASVLAAVGATGFDDYNGVGSDDVQIGRRIVPVRKGVISNNSRSAGGYYNSGQTGSNKRKVAMRVHGARVDTDSDRGEEVYAKGVPIIYQWNEGFDDNGYKPRNFNLKNQAITAESIGADFDNIVTHLSNDMEATINYSGVSESTLRTALEFTFPGMKGSGYNLWSTPDEGFRFEITPQGASYLKNHLTRSRGGRPDTYGDRKLRQLYQARQSTSSRQAIRPRLIKI